MTVLQREINRPLWPVFLWPGFRAMLNPTPTLERSNEAVL
jgi:hypothetical protein